MDEVAVQSHHQYISFDLHLNSLALAVRSSQVASLLPWAMFVEPDLAGKDPMDWYK